MGRVRTEPTFVEQMIRSARTATRLREEAAKDSTDHETAMALLRAAERYSRQVAEYADEMLFGDGR